VEREKEATRTALLGGSGKTGELMTDLKSKISDDSGPRKFPANNIVGFG